MGKLAATNHDATSINLPAPRGADTRKTWLTDCQRGDTWDYGFDDALDTPRTSLRLHDVVSSIPSCNNIQRLTCSPCLRSLPGRQPRPHTSAYKRAQLAADVLHCCTSASIALPALPTQQLPYSLPACLSLAATITITISFLHIITHDVVQLQPIPVSVSVPQELYLQCPRSPQLHSSTHPRGREGMWHTHSHSPIIILNGK